MTKFLVEQTLPPSKYGILINIFIQAKITLGFKASDNLDEMTLAAIHEKFMIKLELVSLM